MSEVLKVTFSRFGKVIAEGEVRRDLAPMNFENLKKVGKTLSSVLSTGNYILINIPLKLLSEGSLPTSFNAGDILIAPVASSLAVVLAPFEETRFRFYKAGEIKTGLEELRKLKSGDSITVEVALQQG